MEALLCMELIFDIGKSIGSVLNELKSDEESSIILEKIPFLYSELVSTSCSLSEMQDAPS
jgi:hypothetical protein